MTKTTLGDWTKPEIDAQCSAAHGQYSRKLALHYTDYFNAHAELRGKHLYSASSMETSLPSGWAGLASGIPAKRRHQHHRSGKSSQALALGLLGVAGALDTEFAWLWRLLDRNPESSAVGEFEHSIPPTCLGETPRVTSIDYLITTPNTVVCVEAKWTERGLGSCSCDKREERYGDDVDAEGDPTIGECSERVLKRAAYWETAHDLFRLPDRSPPQVCPIWTPYQAIRNVAAARALAQGRDFVFCLFYDENNPYFRPSNIWPGWPLLLKTTLCDSGPFAFRTMSWQTLVKMLPLDEQAKVWAREKHCLPV
jgi:hypothetical protein